MLNNICLALFRPPAAGTTTKTATGVITYMVRRVYQMGEDEELGAKTTQLDLTTR